MIRGLIQENICMQQKVKVKKTLTKDYPGTICNKNSHFPFIAFMLNTMQSGVRGGDDKPLPVHHSDH